MSSGILSQVRRSILPQPGDSWESIAVRELSAMDKDAAIASLQSWNLHVFMRASGSAGGVRGDNPILPSDVIFIEPPLARA